MLELSDERKSLKDANHARAVDLVECFRAGDDPVKVLDAFSAAEARIRDIDVRLKVMSLCNSRLSAIHTAATKVDPELAEWRDVCARVRREWQKIDHDMYEDYQLGIRPTRKVDLEAWERKVQARSAATDIARLNLAEDVRLGRYHR